MYNLTKGNKFFLHVHCLTSQTHFNMKGCEPDSFWKRGNSAMACWRVLWLDITTFSDWFKNLAPLCRSIRSKAKTNRALHAHVFPRFVLGFASATWICFECWLVNWIVYWSCLVFCHVFFTSKDLLSWFSYLFAFVVETHSKCWIFSGKPTEGFWKLCQVILK